mgnify:CR=1 FL=1
MAIESFILTGHIIYATQPTSSQCVDIATIIVFVLMNDLYSRVSCSTLSGHNHNTTHAI